MLQLRRVIPKYATKTVPQVPKRTGLATKVAHKTVWRPISNSDSSSSDEDSSNNSSSYESITEANS